LTKETVDGMLIVGVYVDDIVTAGKGRSVEKFRKD
jgi:hypothetical protein